MNKTADDTTAIKVDHVYKDFYLPHDKSNSIKSAALNILKKKSRQPGETQHALSNINFDIKKGEFFGIVGRNGSGKSTLLKILAEIYAPSKGSVQRDGRLVPFIELGVGFNPELTGRENVYLNGALLGFTTKQVDSMYDEIVKFAELEKFMDQKLKNYSSGMQVRLAFSVATRAEADILLVDEVLAVGDAAFQRKCYNHFRKLKKDKKTVVFVSHDMGAIREYCDRAIMIEKSKVVAEGDVNTVADKYTKMFMKEQSKEINPKEEQPDRWGNGIVKVKTVSAQKTEYKEDQYIDIEGEIVANQDLASDEYVIGFSIRNATGGQIMGSNSKILKVDLPPLKKGQTVKFAWRFPNVFNDGTYGIDATVIHPDTTIYDWWEDAAQFVVFKEARTPYPITPNIDFTIK
ncbi:hypothetical protein BGO18_00035 [Candidatus Saccharibacteria bacterium 47-87]|nr:ABC transporter ATP-binding protein [Candidatus Saccharibacteria bacterium]OJU96579.1 MAG: hypothetical protein BGO18_00035 [Candidatus Saccharibacteria bacterium 47-87]